MCYAKIDKNRIYFDSFGRDVLPEIRKYLKSAREFRKGIPVIARNTDVVQSINTHVCGHLCLFALASLMREHQPYQKVLNTLQQKKDRKKAGFYPIINIRDLTIL